jgi:predicted dehydrogenase
MTRTLGVGIIGCGNISQSYLTQSPRFRGIEIRACADLNQSAARQRAEEFGVRAETVDGLLGSSDIDIILNLTIPAAHFEVSRQSLDAGKHVYSEKPFVLDVAQGQELARMATARGLRVGSAPDTFLGGSHQFARHLLDQDRVGKIVGGTCHVMSHGMEHWHPNPDFFFKPGGGPILDLGPYYITNLVQLIGPVRRVAAMSSTPEPERTITSEPRFGEKIAVETPTTIHAVLEFASGAVVTLGASWDVWKNGHAPMELYGDKGTLLVPDPNFFAGEVLHSEKNGDFVVGPVDWDHPFGIANRDLPDGRKVADYRTAGLADMAIGIVEDRENRCGLDVALHVIDVMTSILRSGETGNFITLETTCNRPAALGPDAARALLLDAG